jgi:hypothetical protein
VRIGTSTPAEIAGPSPRSSRGFKLEGGEIVRLNMLCGQLAALGKILIQLAEERRLRGDV